MRNLNKNKQPMYYSLQSDKLIPIYDYYESKEDEDFTPDEDLFYYDQEENALKTHADYRIENGWLVLKKSSGNVCENITKYPIETGEYRRPYLNPVRFMASISMSGGESEASEFGLNKSDYNAVLVMEKGVLPITETSIIWFETEPIYGEDGYVDEHSADYSVVKISPSLNSVKYVLKKMVK